MDREFSSIQELMEGFVSVELKEKLDENQKAAFIWNAANGDIERAHTTGVYLKAGRAGKAPVLGVYLDSAPRVVDFSANKEIYLARLENQGLIFSDIDFKLTRYPKKDADVAGGSERTAPAPELPELDEAELRYVEELVEEVPESLRPTVYETVSLMLRREKLESADFV